MLGLRSRGGYYLSIIDSITALCTFREGSFEESSDEEIVPTVEHVRDSGWVDAQKGGAGGVPSLRRPLAGKKAGLVNRSKVCRDDYRHLGLLAAWILVYL